MEFSSHSITIDRSLALGVGWGITAWSCYALVEFAFCALWPLLTVERAVITPLNWNLHAWLFNAYSILGAVTGGLLGLLGSWIARTFPSARISVEDRFAGMVSLYVAILVHILTLSQWQF